VKRLNCKQKKYTGKKKMMTHIFFSSSFSYFLQFKWELMGVSSQVALVHTRSPPRLESLARKSDGRMILLWQWSEQ